MIDQSLDWVTDEISARAWCRQQGVEYAKQSSDGTSWIVTHPDGREEIRPMELARTGPVPTAAAVQNYTPARYLKERLTGSFMSRDFEYKNNSGRFFYSNCEFDIGRAVFLASHADSRQWPLASVLDGSLFVNLPYSGEFWVKRLRDTPESRQLVEDIRAKRITGCSFEAAFQDVGPDDRVRSAQLTHICAAARPKCPWTSIRIY